MSPETPHRPAALQSEVVKADFFDKIGYSTVWEDERIIEQGLAPAPGERALSITSGADFSLQLLLYDLEEVISVDFNPRQNFLLHLKKAALVGLDHDTLWQFLGLRECRNRVELYRSLRQSLPSEARTYWDAHTGDIARGVLRCGTQDRYLHLVGRAIRFLQGPKTVAGLFSAAGLDAQREYFSRHWNGLRWKALTWILFNRRVLDMAFHKDHFRYAHAQEHPAVLLRRQAERVIRDIPTRDNFYLYWLFYGTYPDKERRCPAWLRSSNFEKLRKNSDRLCVRTAELETFIFEQPTGSIDCFNFSNIFDWVSTEAFVELMGQVVRTARPGARLCYWTNTVNTRRELALACRTYPRLEERRALAEEIYRVSRTPGYSSCTLGVVR